jgi:hypothetical protein
MDIRCLFSHVVLITPVHDTSFSSTAHVLFLGPPHLPSTWLVLSLPSSRMSLPCASVSTNSQIHRCKRDPCLDPASIFSACEDSEDFDCGGFTLAPLSPRSQFHVLVLNSGFIGFDKSTLDIHIHQHPSCIQTSIPQTKTLSMWLWLYASGSGVRLAEPSDLWVSSRRDHTPWWLPVLVEEVLAAGDQKCFTDERNYSCLLMHRGGPTLSARWGARVC